MNWAEAKRYEEMRKQGMSIKRIADASGQQEHRVRYILDNYAETQFKWVSAAQCIYSGLRNWLNENECGISELVRRIYGDSCTTAAVRRYYWMLRGDRRLTIDDIDDILSLTGSTYEELFGMEGC